MSNPLYKGNVNVPTAPAVPPNEIIMQNMAESISYLKRFQSPQHFWQAVERENPEMAQKLRYLQGIMQNPMQSAMQIMNQQGIDFNKVMSMVK